jgi:hypothetical protein
MKRSRLILPTLLFVFGLLFMLLTPGARAWQVSIFECSGCGSRAESVVVDAAGDVISVGGFGYGADMIKISGANGSVIWRSKVMGHESRNYAQDLAIDSHGDLFVVFAWTRVVVKVSGADGTEMWRKPIGGTLNALLPIVNAVKVDRDDNVVTAGTMGGYFNVYKLDGITGDEKWHNDARGGMANGIAVDANGDVAAAGIMSRNFATVKLRGQDGQEIWHNEIDGAGNFSNDFEEANAVAIDQDGSVVAAGVTSNEIANFRDFTVAKYLPDGTTAWIEIVDGNYVLQNDRGEQFNQSNDIAYAVTIDKDGNVIAAGSIQEDNDVPATGHEPEHFRVVKIAKQGGVVWSKPADEHVIGQDYIDGHAFTVAVDGAGDVAASGVHGGRFTVVKFQGSTGAKAWPAHQISSGGLGNGNNGLSVVMDHARDIVAAGEIIGSDGFSKFTVIKLHGTDGADYFATPSPTPTPTPAPSPSPTPVQDPVTAYAPLVWLHPQELYWPTDPSRFINTSRLLWSHDINCADHAIPNSNPIDVTKLGDNSASSTPYSHRRRQYYRCAHDTNFSEPFTTRQHTRPNDNNRPGLETFNAEGFYLDLPNSARARRGTLSASPDISIYSGVPVYYEYIHSHYVAYWFFYAYDDYRIPRIGSVQGHEGDWERISILLDDYDRPLKVFYYSHKDGVEVDWNDVVKYGTHPFVFSAKGTHGSYPTPGPHELYLPNGSRFCLPILRRTCLFDQTDHGRQWRTWENLLDVKQQPWYGYGGAWGEVRGGTVGGLVPASENTGPLGPSQFKTSARSNWTQSYGGPN